MRVRVDFESGSLADWEVLGPGHLRVAARADRSPRPLWFHFQVEGLDAPELRVELANASDCLGPRHGWRTARPVYRPVGGGGENRRLEIGDSAEGTAGSQSPSGASTTVGHLRSPDDGWRRAPAGRFEDGRRGTFTFSLPCGKGGDALAVAYCYPYTLSDLQAYQDQHAGWEEVGRSVEERPLSMATFGPAGAPAVWVLARQHAGESPASFALEGLVDCLRQSDPGADAARFHVVPMVDVDGVFHGRYGKDSAPVDFNRDWTDAPRRPELAALTRAVEASASASPPVLLLDLHASHHGDTSCYLFGSPEKGPSPQARFLERLAQEAPATVGFRRTDLRPDTPPAGSAREYFTRRYGALSLCVELSYHLAQSGRYLTPGDYRDFGAALARAAVGWVAQDG